MTRQDLVETHLTAIKEWEGLADVRTASNTMRVPLQLSMARYSISVTFLRMCPHKPAITLVPTESIALQILRKSQSRITCHVAAEDCENEVG